MNHPIWQGRAVAVAFIKESASPDVTVKAYWNNPDNDKCRNSIACTTNRSGAYPHLGEQQLWIEYPPQFPGDPAPGEKNYPRWTDDLALAQNSSMFHHLPSVLMHEFGHTAGLGHASVGIMSGALHAAPQPYDVNGMHYNYENHTKH